MNLRLKTFAAAIDAAVAHTQKHGIVLARPAELWNLCQEPLFYEQTRRGDFEIETLRKRKTGKFFHVSIYRLPHGHYELTQYVL